MAAPTEKHVAKAFRLMMGAEDKLFFVEFLTIEEKSLTLAFPIEMLPMMRQMTDEALEKLPHLKDGFEPPAH